MKRILEMIQKSVLNGIGGVPLDYYLFIVIFFAKISSVLIFECLFDVFSVYQHEILLVEKYTYFLVAGYVALYHVMASDRLHLAKVVIDMVKTSPWIGVGWNVKILQHDSAHNVFLSVLAWTGIIGLIIFVLLLISVVINGVKTKSIQRNPLLFMILLCVMVQCLFEQGIVGDNRHAYTYLFWLILGYFGRINPQINEQ